MKDKLHIPIIENQPIFISILGLKSATLYNKLQLMPKPKYNTSKSSYKTYKEIILNQS